MFNPVELSNRKYFFSIFQKKLNLCITAIRKSCQREWPPSENVLNWQGFLSSLGMAPAYEYFARMVELNFPILFPCEETMRVSLWKEQQTWSNSAKWEQSVLSLPLIPTQPCLKGTVWLSRNSVSLTELCVTSNKLKDARRAFVLLSWRVGRRRLVLKASYVYVGGDLYRMCICVSVHWCQYLWVSHLHKHRNPVLSSVLWE